MTGSETPADPPGSEGRLLARLAAMMYLEYFALGMWFVTLTSYIGANTGQQGERIFSEGFAGYSGMAAALGSLLAPTVFGWLADRGVAAKHLLAALHGVATVAATFMHQARAEWAFLAGLILYFQAFAPTVSLTNTIALRLSRNPDRDFPVLRLFGTVAWISSGVFLGFVAPRLWGGSIEGTRTPIAIGAGLHVAMTLYCLTLPATRPARRRGEVRPERALAVMRNRGFVFFLAVSLITAVGSQAYHLANMFMNQQGYTGPAATLTLGQLVELVCLGSMPWLRKHFRLKTLVLVGILAWAFRYVLLALGSLGDPDSVASVAVVLAILCHGPAYGFVYVVGQVYLDRLVKPENRGAAQGLHLLATTGVGHLLGSGLSGWAQSTFLTPAGVTPPPYDWFRFWLTPVTLLLLAAAVFWLRFTEHPSRRESDDETVATFETGGPIETPGVNAAEEFGSDSPK